MSMNDGMYSSATPEWSTPQELFDKINQEFGLKLDVCATRENAKLYPFYSKDDDGLKKSWAGMRCWMNPPYGREIGKWVAKASREASRGALVVCLLPARTDTKWFHEYIYNAKAHAPYNNVEIRFLKGRIKFGGGENSAPFPSMVVIFRPFKKEA